ncbi:MAG: hypothetical protein IPO21_09870 [Bacteroidales bacterium]|nr:hypothetical protein [Bacteroidales bacterium]
MKKIYKSMLVALAVALGVSFASADGVLETSTGGLEIGKKGAKIVAGKGIINAVDAENPTIKVYQFPSGVLLESTDGSSIEVESGKVYIIELLEGGKRTTTPKKVYVK